eukprot:s24_g44.t1
MHEPIRSQMLRGTPSGKAMTRVPRLHDATVAGAAQSGYAPDWRRRSQPLLQKGGAWFLELVKETCDDYAEINEIVERHSTLETANTDLAEIQTESETKIEELRGEFQSYKKEQEMEMMELRNKVATLQIELDECQKKRQQLQHEFDEATLEDSEHSLKFGQILMSVENLFLRCTTKRKNIQHAQTPVDDEGKQEGPVAVFYWQRVVRE